MGLIIGLKDLIKELPQLRTKGTVGLVTGRFDILHTGHIGFLRFAKNKVDTLIVGVDTDISINKTMLKKGPIHSQEDRMKVLSELISVDYVVPLDSPYSYKTKSADQYYLKITKLIKPNYLITSKRGDMYWEHKKNRIEALGGELILSDSNSEIPIQSQVINLIYN